MSVMRLIAATFAASVLLSTVVLAQALDSRVERRVEQVSKTLDRAAGALEQGKTSQAERALAQAQKDYDKIFEFYGGKFDPEHPKIVALKQRIDALGAKVGAPAEAAKPAAPAVPATARPQGLPDAVMRRVDQANGTLDQAEDRLAKGDGKGAERFVAQAQGQYDKLFQYYKDKFDPDDAAVVALQQRIDALGARTDALAQATAKPAAGASGGYNPNKAEFERTLNSAETQLNDFDRMKRDSDGSEMWLRPMQAKLQQAEMLLGDVRHRHAPLVSAAPDRVAALEQRLEAARAELEAMRQAQPAQAAARASAAHADEVARIQGRFKDKGLYSQRHREHVGRMIWSNRQIGLDVQDTVPLKSEFALAEPLFGRLYLARSLGNTPLYGGSDDKPRESIDYRYRYRLYVDGEEKTPNGDRFSDGRLNDQGGQTWTTWQLALNPEPYDDIFKGESKAWRAVTRTLAPGRHQVRLELWSEQGIYLSDGPVAVGEFTLSLGAGAKLALQESLPADAYAGGDLDQVRAEMRRALVGPVAKAAGEILEVRVTSEWNHKRYIDTKRRYRAIMGTVLWADSDGDKVCRFTSYNFTSDETGANAWSPLKFRSFCNGCPEGEVDCPG